MNYISTHFTLEKTESGSIGRIARNITDRKTMVDRFIELIVYTPKGKFHGDPDFGFEYWNQEYSNVIDDAFNKNNTGIDDFYREGMKKRCEESVRKSLLMYVPELTEVEVLMHLDAAFPDFDGQDIQKIKPHHLVVVGVTGKLSDNLGTTTDYSHIVKFFIEPMSKRA